MAYENIKTIIDTYIKSNGANAITGAINNTVLTAILDALKGYKYGGVITTTSTFTADADHEWFFLASDNGTYANYDEIILENEICVITYSDGVFAKTKIADRAVSNVIATLGIGLAGDLPTSGQINDIYVSTDSFIIFTYSGAEWIETPLTTGQFVTDPVGETLYQYTGTSLITIKSVTVSGGGVAANIYFQNAASVVVPAYKNMSYLSEVSETIVTGSATNSEVLIGTYLFNLPIDTTEIPQGMWYGNFFVKVDSAIGVTQLKCEAFLYHEDTSETTLFSGYSREINDLDYALLQFPQYDPSSHASALTDYVGVRLYIKTTSTSQRTISIKVGDGSAAYFQSPLGMRHQELRDKNGETNFQHVTTAQITGWNNKVDGPSSSLDNSIPVFDGVTGKLLKDNSGVSIVGGKMLIGTGASGFGKVDISDGGIGLVIGGDINADTRTDATSKYCKIAMPHYTNSEEPFGIITALNSSVSNQIIIGGGSVSVNAATKVSFYTTANATTVSGTERGFFDSAGLLTALFGAAITGNITATGTINKIKDDIATGFVQLNFVKEIDLKVLNQEITLATIPAGRRGFVMDSNYISSWLSENTGTFGTAAVITLYFTAIGYSETNAAINIDSSTFAKNTPIAPLLEPNTTVRAKVTTATTGSTTCKLALAGKITY